MTSRPEDLIYAVDERPPPLRWALLGCQHAVLMSVYLVLIVIVFRRAGAGHEETLSALALGMVALAISTVLQAQNRGPVGSGYLAPPVFSAIYIGPAVLAAQTGGLPAVFGMTIFAGLVEAALAPCLSRLRGLFPPALSGFIVFIVGVQLGLIGIGDLLGVAELGRPDFTTHLLVASATLALMVGLSVWGGGLVRLMCSMIGIVTGLLMAWLAGLIRPTELAAFEAAPFLAVPSPDYLTYRFDPTLIPAFLIAGVAAMLRTVGVVTTCQKINDQDWKRPELRSIRGGILADGIGCAIGGALGVIGMNTGPSLVGVSRGTGATSRAIAYSCAAALLIFALIPKYAALFLMLPSAVIGAAMVFTAAFMISGGVQIITSRNLDTRTTYTVGIATLMGLARDVFPAFFNAVPAAIHAITGSVMSAGVITAFLLNLAFRLGATRKVVLELDAVVHSQDELDRVLRTRGKAWSIPMDIVERAQATTLQVLRHLAQAGVIRGPARAVIAYDDVDLVVTVQYDGVLLSLPHVGVKKRFFLEEESFSYGLADFLTGVFPDRMEASAKGPEVTIRLVFNV